MKNVNRINLMQGDIAQVQGFDAIVNAANSTLLGGGGVDGAIHNGAGPELLKECMALKGCPTGGARITNAYHLPCKKIIHAVGPQYSPNNPEAPVLLYAAYSNCLELALQNGLRKIAFPSISTGIYQYPVDEAANIAIQAALDFLEYHPDFLITWVLYDKETYTAYEQAVRNRKRLAKGKGDHGILASIILVLIAVMVAIILWRFSGSIFPDNVDAMQRRTDTIFHSDGEPVPQQY